MDESEVDLGSFVTVPHHRAERDMTRLERAGIQMYDGEGRVNPTLGTWERLAGVLLETLTPDAQEPAKPEVKKDEKEEGVKKEEEEQIDQGSSVPQRRSKRQRIKVEPTTITATTTTSVGSSRKSAKKGKGKGKATTQAEVEVKVEIKTEAQVDQEGQDVKPDLATLQLPTHAGSSTLTSVPDIKPVFPTAVPSTSVSEQSNAVASSSRTGVNYNPAVVLPETDPESKPSIAAPVTKDEIDDIKPSAKDNGKSKGKGKAKVDPEPKRLKRWRKKCPQATMERLGRVMDQRMFMMDRSGRGEGDNALSETFKVLGSTGNVYTVTIDAMPRCDCPDARNGAGNIPCKHIIFVFIKVLKLVPSSELWYQKSLFDDELRTIFSTAPPVAMGAYEVPARARAAWLKATGQEALIPESDREPEPTEVEVKEQVVVDKHRKEAVGEDCPVCYEEMTQSDSDKNLLVWDDGLYGCGKALHAECFRNWSASIITRGGAGAEITCVWCRGPWPNPVPGAGAGGQGSSRVGVQYTAGGYMNIADLVGVSRKRDTSSYYHGPIRGRRMDEPRYEDDYYY